MKGIKYNSLLVVAFMLGATMLVGAGCSFLNSDQGTNETEGEAEVESVMEGNDAMMEEDSEEGDKMEGEESMMEGEEGSMMEEEGEENEAMEGGESMKEEGEEHMVMEEGMEPLMEDGMVVKEVVMESSVFFESGQAFPRFSVRDITVNKGDKVRIKVTVTSGSHDFKLDEFGIYEETPLNEEVTIEFVADKAGEFIYYCNKPGHRANGHWGTLIVKE